VPELAAGAELELKPDDPFEVPEPDPDEVPDPDPDEVPEPAEVPDPVEDVPELDFAEDGEVEVLVVWVAPGRTSATAPAAATLARLTAVVAERTLARPRSLAATARRTWSRCALLMSPILRSGARGRLHGTSRLAQRHVADWPGPRLRRQHEGRLKPPRLAALAAYQDPVLIQAWQETEQLTHEA
jgi:hypothetical protein